MAQIIRHRKGVLASVKDATKRKAELLVVTGSSITSTNSDAMIFVGDGDGVTPANKIIYGTDTPDLTDGNTYDSSIDGIPYYNTSENKLFILAQSGNIEIQATANTNGTGILSGSDGIAALGANIVSSSSQISIVTDGTGIFSGSEEVAADFFAENQSLNVGTGTLTAGTLTTGGTLNVTGISNLGIISGSNLDLTGNANIQGNIVLGGNITIGDASTDTIAFGGDITTDIIPSANNTLDLGSATDKFAEVHATTLFGAISATNGIVSQSAQTLVHVNQSIPGVISGSTQLDGTVIGSTSEIEASGSFSGSFVGDGSGLTGLATNLDVNGSDVDLLLDDLNIVGTANEISVTTAKDGTDVNVTVALPDDVIIGDSLTVTGDLTVNGTQTIVNSEILNVSSSIQRLNYGGGAVNGGLEVTDATGTLATGSLLWDGTNDYWKAGAKASEKRVIVEGGSAGTANTVSKFDAAGTVINSIITDNGSTATIGGELIVSGLVANSFVVTNASKQLLEVTPSTAGDVIQWNGSAFAASNVIDGGSF